jgi:RNA polymerase sigma-70 factor (ECF subfamily)
MNAAEDVAVVTSVSRPPVTAAHVAEERLSTLEDAALMLRYRDGDIRAFEVLYERHKGPLYRYLQRMCHRRETADDLFQEVWGKVIATRERYEVRAQFNTFLFRIAHNCAVDHFRRAEHRHASRTEDVDAIADRLPGAGTDEPEARVGQAQIRTDFLRALDELPSEQRDVFVLYEETGLSLEEIGRITGVAMETAKSRLRYAVSKLRAALGEHRTLLQRSAES